jgi:hypothetical protein
MKTTQTCTVGGVFKVQGRMAACAHSMVGQSCGLPTEEACEYRRSLEPTDAELNKMLQQESISILAESGAKVYRMPDVS